MSRRSTLLGLGALIATATLAPASSAQLTDLQPGRNFPTAQIAFGGNLSENVDVADVDNDGDYDVGISNGGDGGPQPNRLYLNNGGAQGGTAGTFTEGTSTRFAGVPNDTSRDIEFVDFEDDGDFDVYISNRGTTVNGGEVSRAYVNQGGRQNGSIGFFTEGTNDFWGTLVSVPGSDEDGAVDGAGPWRDFSCDCDFADIDDDGDIDLFHSSYGPNISGDRDTRLFLNDGDGQFNEHWPWIDPGADIRIHTLDIDIADFDGDFDADIFASSRDSQARVWRNNLFGGTGSGMLFTDVTQTALIDQGATLSGGANYEAEFADMDGDGDFDVWAKNYGDGTLDVTLVNNGNMQFREMDWIRSDPNFDENEVDFLDYDNDGDLDVFVANFGGENWIYTNSTAQGVNPSLGRFHRNGVPGLASWPEAPAASNGGTTLDADAADMDGDGDTDLLLSNDGNQQNRYWQNVGGTPDTFAPTFERITNQGNKTDGSDTVIHAQVRDNANYYVMAFYKAELIYSINGGAERCVRMFSQGGQQFRAVIPGGENGTVEYHVEVTDDAGNTGVSGSVQYTQSGGSGDDLWASISCGTEGVSGVPVLKGSGAFTPGAQTIYSLRDAAPSSFSILFVSLTSMPIPFKGGTLHPVPVDLFINRSTDDGGLDSLIFPWPAGVPSGTEFFLQYGVQDLSVIPYGAALSNAIRNVAP